MQYLKSKQLLLFAFARQYYLFWKLQYHFYSSVVNDWSPVGALNSLNSIVKYLTILYAEYVYVQQIKKHSMKSLT